MTPPPETAALRELVARWQDRPVLVLGDCMLDHYIMGEVGRISPEAPVPVVKVRAERHTAGGAGNVARNLAALGARPVLLSAVGDDDAGGMLAALLESGGVEAVLAREPSRPTTIKTRIIAQNQQMVRVDREAEVGLGEGARDLLIGAVRRLVPNMAAVVVSDYAKGVIGPELMAALLAARGYGPDRPMVLVDPKPANRALYAGADLLTPNRGEAEAMSGVRADSQTGVLKAGLALFRQCRCRHVCITLGADGIALFRSPEAVTHFPTAARRVFDVTGAGDSVMAALACALGAGGDVLEACRLANVCAGIAVSQVGAVAVTRDELETALRRTAPPEPETWLDLRGESAKRATASDVIRQAKAGEDRDD